MNFQPPCSGGLPRATLLRLYPLPCQSAHHSTAQPWVSCPRRLWYRKEGLGAQCYEHLLQARLPEKSRAAQTGSRTQALWEGRGSSLRQDTWSPQYGDTSDMVHVLYACTHCTCITYYTYIRHCTHITHVCTPQIAYIHALHMCISDTSNITVHTMHILYNTNQT